MTHPPRKIAAPICVAILLTVSLACGTPRPPLPPSLELPRPVIDLRGTRKADKVTLVWTVPVKTTDNTILRHLGPTLVCRSLEVAINRCDPVGSVPPSGVPAKQEPHTSSKKPNNQVPAPVATYTDVLLPRTEEQDATGFASYAVEPQNTDARGAGLSNQIRIPLVPTLRAPTDVTAAVTQDGVALTWSGVLPDLQSPGVSYTYRLYRRDRSTKAAALAGELPLVLTAAPKFVDTGMEWQKTYDYWITVVSVLSKTRGPVFQVEGDDSPLTTVEVIDVFPPATPNGVQAVASGEGQQPYIDLTWAPNTEADLAGYNVYRRQGTADWIKINQGPVKTPTFRDADVVRGNDYSYSVSAVDLRGNESPRSDETAEQVH
jgi:hypothetical protein